MRMVGKRKNTHSGWRAQEGVFEFDGYAEFSVAKALPRPADVVDTELIGMAGPVRRRLKSPASRRTRLRRVASELVIDRVVQILTHAPRVRLTHVGGRRHDQGRRLTIALVVIIAVPGSCLGKIPIPDVSHAINIACRCRRMGCGQRLAGGDNGQADQEFSNHDVTLKD